MKFTRTAAEKLVNDLVVFSRESLQEYKLLSDFTSSIGFGWNDKQKERFDDVIDDMNNKMRKTFSSVSDYKKHLDEKIRDL